MSSLRSPVGTLLGLALLTAAGSLWAAETGSPPPASALLPLDAVPLSSVPAARAPSTLAASSVLHREIYVPVGLTLFSSGSRLVAGVGGGLGYRYDLDEIWSVFTEGKTNFYTGTFGSLTMGITGRFRFRSWSPELGVGGMLVLGEGIRVLDAADPTIPPPIAGAITTRISPLRFVRGRFAASALSIDVGCGIDTRSRCAFALSVALLEAGLRF
jgi:hypothetical protein